MPLLATLVCCSLLAASVGQDEAVAPLLVVVTDASTGAPLPEADVRWLALTAHDARLADEADWPHDLEAAVLRGGTPLALDVDGRARLDAPLGGLIVLARTHDRFLLREVASGTNEVTLALEVEVSLTVTFERPSGAPLVGASAGLWAGAVAPGSVSGASRVLYGTTDTSGALTFRRVQTQVPELTEFVTGRGSPPPMHVELDVVGERVAFHLDADALTARAAMFTAPPLGVVAVHLLDLDVEGRRASQAVNVRDVEPARLDRSREQFSGAVDGVLRRFVPLGRRFEVRALDRRVLGLLATVVAGPREDGEVVELGPLTPDDHAELRLVTGLASGDLHGGALVRVSVDSAGSLARAPFARVVFGASDLGPEGELALLVPRAVLGPPGVPLRVALWSDGRERCACDVSEGLAAGARLEVPLATALAAASASAPAAELLVTGFVVDPAGRRVPGAEVSVLEDDPASFNESFQSPAVRGDGSLRTDARGAFEVRYGSDARRFQLFVGGAGFATQRVVVAERGARDLRVTLGPTALVHARVLLDEGVPPERIVVDLVEGAPGKPTLARRMRHLGRGVFVGETMESGPAALRVHSRVTVMALGQGARTDELLVASLPFELGEGGGDVQAPDVDLRGRLVPLAPRAVDAVSGPALGAPGQDVFALATLPTGERPRPTAPTSPRTFPVVDLEVLDDDGRPFARRQLHACWLWPGSDVAEGRRTARELVYLHTDALGRLSLSAEDVPLQHKELELALVARPGEGPSLHARTRWSARAELRSAPRPPVTGSTVAGAGAVRLGPLEPIVTGRVLDRAGRPVAGAGLELVDELRSRRAHGGETSRFETLRVSESDSDGRFEAYAPSGSDLLVLRAVRVRDGSARLAAGGAAPMPRGARDVVVLAERLATAVIVVKLAEGVGPAHIAVALVGPDGTRSSEPWLAVQGREHRYELRGVEPGVHTLQVSVGATMSPLGAPESSERVLFESAPTPIEWRADGPTTFPAIDLTHELAVTQVAVALDGASPYFSPLGARAACIGVFALDGAGAIQRGVTVRGVWWRPRSLELGGLELLTRSRAPLALEVAGALSVRSAGGEFHSRVVRSERVHVGAGVATVEVALEDLPPLQLRVSPEIVQALGPHHLYAIAWRSATEAAEGGGSPTASFGAFDVHGELALTAPVPWPGAGETKVEVELVLVSNPGQYPGDLAAALDFPRVRRELAAHYAVDLDGENIPRPQPVPRAERVLALDEREQPMPFRVALPSPTATPIRLEVDIAAVRSARALLERE